MNDERHEDKKYNGWTNYETWVVRLWLDNEEPSYRFWTEEARRWKGQELANVHLANQLEEDLTDASPVQGASVYADLMNAALNEVNWLEIAESYLADVPDEWTGESSVCDASPMPSSAPEEQPQEEPTQSKSESGDTSIEDLFGPVISSYTRAQGIEDGVLVDVTETAKEAGFRIPVALTREAWAKYVVVPDGVSCQDEAGRLWDVLFMCHYGISRGEGQACDLLFELHVRNDNREGEPPLVTLKAVCGPNDDASPCITIMLPEED